MLGPEAEPQSQSIGLEEWLTEHPELWCAGHSVQAEVYLQSAQLKCRLRLAGGQCSPAKVVVKYAAAASN